MGKFIMSRPIVILRLYNLIGVDPEYTVGDFGRTNLSRATVRRARDGYVLVFPSPRAL